MESVTHAVTGALGYSERRIAARLLERDVRESGLSHAILRPSVLFGVFGDGRYGIRPIHVDDLAALAVRCGFDATTVVIDAVGPERFRYGELVRRIAEAIGVRRAIVPVAPAIGYWIGRAVGLAVGDCVLTRDEIDALVSGLLDSDAPATGSIKLSDWARQHASSLGRHYASELARRTDHAPKTSPA